SRGGKKTRITSATSKTRATGSTKSTSNNIKGGGGPRGSDRDASNLNMCRHFMAGRCFVNHCRFAHIIFGADTTSVAPSGTSSAVKGDRNSLACQPVTAATSAAPGPNLLGGLQPADNVDACIHFLGDRCFVADCRFPHIRSTDLAAYKRARDSGKTADFLAVFDQRKGPTTLRRRQIRLEMTPQEERPKGSLWDVIEVNDWLVTIVKKYNLRVTSPAVWSNIVKGMCQQRNVRQQQKIVRVFEVFADASTREPYFLTHVCDSNPTPRSVTKQVVKVKHRTTTSSIQQGATSDNKKSALSSSYMRGSGASSTSNTSLQHATTASMGDDNANGTRMRMSDPSSGSQKDEADERGSGTSDTSRPGKDASSGTLL
ncbi:unnamed protein product, partial [Amoebophrya sp. A25]